MVSVSDTETRFRSYTTSYPIAAAACSQLMSLALHLLIMFMLCIVFAHFLIFLCMSNIFLCFFVDWIEKTKKYKEIQWKFKKSTKKHWKYKEIRSITKKLHLEIQGNARYKDEEILWYSFVFIAFHSISSYFLVSFSKNEEEVQGNTKKFCEMQFIIFSIF